MMHKEIQQKIDLKTKPIGALGYLEDIALQICQVQQSLHPQLKNPCIIVFAADHGVSKSGVSAYPSEVTAQMVLNFLNDGAAINVFCKQNNIKLLIADAGVNYDFEKNNQIIDSKIAKGTNNFLHTKAMTSEQLKLCFDKANDIINNLAENGTNIIGFGEMGIGNTSSAALIMSEICELPIDCCVGRGTGLKDDQFNHKLSILKQVQENHSKPNDIFELLTSFGGFEIAQMCAAMLQSYQRGMLIMVDGFIATAAFLCAYKLEPNIINNAIFCHLSDEQGHQRMLDYLNVKPLLKLNMRLGEGIGCALAYPLIQSAVNFMNEMASFESAGVSNKIKE